MKRQVEEEINQLKAKLLHMGGLAEEMIHFSMKCFIERESGFGEKVFKNEEEVNRLQIDVDELAGKILALYQPEASDLRTIIAAMKINSEIERVADQAVNITQTCTLHLFKETPIKTMMEIPRMATIAQEMIKDALDAFSRGDVELAQAVLKKDEEEDTLKAKVLSEIIGQIRKRPAQTQQLVDLILISRNLEKIGDHATNIAEDAIYMTIGKDIRHPNQQEPSSVIP
ncbi:MAG: phosphate transport system regulatory protein PhoU [Elusimicrobia bacterium RIFCSPLOWO2_01_FULL_60_11]|nr:MAG: phosphate transport system regulatory protein PhoU [Elusimicrobia bacterium RIFCSPLOWO2_01_FULL_60_11]